VKKVIDRVASINWLPALFLAWKERSYARRASAEMLGTYHLLSAEHPEITGAARYEKVLARHGNLDPKGVRGVIWGAEQSFARWPVDRDLLFQDVVLYYVIDKYLKSAKSRRTTQIHMEEIVRSVVPANL